MRSRPQPLLTFIALLFITLPAVAQRVALKTNTLDWLLISPNLSLEARLSQRLTFNIGVAANPFKQTPYGSDYRFSNVRLNPELRYWFNRSMARHFVGVAMTGGIYDIQFRSHRYKGNLFAAGITYGYALVLNRHWNVEFTLGLGLARTWGYDYRSWQSQPQEHNMARWVPYPVGTGISFSYIFQ